MDPATFTSWSGRNDASSIALARVLTDICIAPVPRGFRGRSLAGQGCECISVQTGQVRGDGPAPRRHRPRPPWAKHKKKTLLVGYLTVEYRLHYYSRHVAVCPHIPGPAVTKTLQDKLYIQWTWSGPALFLRFIEKGSGTRRGGHPEPTPPRKTRAMDVSRESAIEK